MSRQGRILIVDEEPLIGEVIRATVEDFGHVVRAVQSEAEAIAALTEPYDVLFLHRRLPHSTCNDLVRLARQHTEPAIVLLSSQRSLEAEKNMLRLGAAEILYKPLDPIEIRACIERQLAADRGHLEVVGGPRVLVVDDDEAVLLSIRDMLEDHYEVTGTTSPYEALRLLRESPFEVLLSDLMMDELPGIELIRAAYNTRPLLQAIVMTGYASQQTAIAALKEGVYDFLEKPLTPDVVRQTIARAWKLLRYQLENRKLLAELRAQVEAREQLLAERERLITDLESKNAELERFAYTVSHDLTTPLVTIKGFLGLLRKDFLAGDLERLDHDIGRITTAVDRMCRLLDDLLDLSRVGRVVQPPARSAFGELAREAVELAEPQLTRRRVEVEIAPDLPVVCGDRARLLEVLQNLIENAAKYMGEQPAPRIEIGASADGEQVIFWVRDNGIGIEPQYHQQIFGLFNRLDAAGEGTGVGLALVKRIVELHGGRVWVESAGAGEGSTFFFTLPNCLDEAAATAEPGS